MADIPGQKQTKLLEHNVEDVCAVLPPAGQEVLMKMSWFGLRTREMGDTSSDSTRMRGLYTYRARTTTSSHVLDRENTATQGVSPTCQSHMP